MGRVHAVTTTAEGRQLPFSSVVRAAEFSLAAVALVLALPLMVVLSIAVRLSSHGPVLQRELGIDRRGRPVRLLSFRTALDGAGTAHHGRLRAVVGAGDRAALTPVGRFMRATRTDRLPRLLNVLAGQAGLLRRQRPGG